MIGVLQLSFSFFFFPFSYSPILVPRFNILFLTCRVLILFNFLQGGSCDEGESCDNVLLELENIDDELDEAGIIFVTTEDMPLAKKYGIRSFPTLAFFRNKEPLIYPGDLGDEDEVLSWITDENTLEIPGKIEEVNSKLGYQLLHFTGTNFVSFIQET